MLRYHIKITDNETGEVITERDYSCIIGGFGFDGGATEGRLYACNTISVVSTLEAALNAVEAVFASNPEFRLAFNIAMKKGGLLGE